MSYITNLIFGKVQEKESTKKCQYKGMKFDCSPGLSFADEHGIRCAKQAGWICSFKNYTEIWMSDETEIDFVSRDGMKLKLATFANYLVKLASERNGLRVSMEKEQREQLTPNILKELSTCLGVGANFFADGYFVVKSRRENSASQPDAVERKIKQFALRGIMGPLFVTPMAMRQISDSNALLELESEDANCSVKFDPTISTASTGRHSTALNSMLEESINDLTLEISNISFTQDLANGTLDSIADQSVVDNNTVDEDDFHRFRDQLNETFTNQRCLARDVLNNKTSSQEKE